MANTPPRTSKKNWEKCAPTCVWKPIIKTPSIQICHDKQEDHTYKSQGVFATYENFTYPNYEYRYWDELDVTIENIHTKITSLLELSTWETI